MGAARLTEEPLRRPAGQQIMTAQELLVAALSAFRATRDAEAQAVIPMLRAAGRRGGAVVRRLWREQRQPSIRRWVVEAAAAFRAAWSRQLLSLDSSVASVP